MLRYSALVAATPVALVLASSAGCSTTEAGDAAGLGDSRGAGPESGQAATSVCPPGIDPRTAVQIKAAPSAEAQAEFDACLGSTDAKQTTTQSLHTQQRAHFLDYDLWGEFIWQCVSTKPLHCFEMGLCAKTCRKIALQYGTAPERVEYLMHTCWQACLTCDAGMETATEIGDQHENAAHMPWDRVDSCRDQIHNRIARSIGQNCCPMSGSNLSTPVYDAATWDCIGAGIADAWTNPKPPGPPVKTLPDDRCPDLCQPYPNRPAGVMQLPTTEERRRFPGVQCLDERCEYLYTAAQCTRIVTASLIGTGDGVITGAGINCGDAPNQTACDTALRVGDKLPLTATAAAGSTFLGWSGACKGNGACVVTVDGNKNVTAEFRRDGVNLRLSRTGAGIGAISWSGNGLNGGLGVNDPPSADSYVGTVGRITLGANAALGSAFVGWGGACTGQGTGRCVLDLQQANTEVSAQFEPDGIGYGDCAGYSSVSLCGDPENEFDRTLAAAGITAPIPSCGTGFMGLKTVGTTWSDTPGVTYTVVDGTYLFTPGHNDLCSRITTGGTRNLGKKFCCYIGTGPKNDWRVP